MIIRGYKAAMDATPGIVGEIETLVMQTTASVVKLSSGSADDAAAGTGARTVQVTGLLSTYVEASETVILNGQTAVNTTNSYVAINKVEVLTAGSGGVNAGIVYAGTGTVTTGVPAVVNNAITVGANVSTSAFYVMPAKRNFKVNKLQIAASAAATLSLVVVEQGSGLALTTITLPIAAAAAYTEVNLTDTLIIPEKALVKISAAGTSLNIGVALIGDLRYEVV